MIPPDIATTMREALVAKFNELDDIIRHGVYAEPVGIQETLVAIDAAIAYLDTLPAAPAPDSRELLSCPFCGGNGVIHVDYVLGPNEPLYSPMCEHLSYWYEHRFQPGHKGHPKCGGSIGASFTTQAEAVAAWNRRATLVARPTDTP